MKLKSIISLVKNSIKRIRKTIELNRYNSFTIAEYFRKQGAQIGDNCYIIPRSLGGEPYLIKIGNHVAINQGVKLHTHDGGTWIFRDEMPDMRVFGPICIEDNCLIGTDAQILPNIRIGKNSIVGAGSVVISDVEPNTIVMGVPARKFGSTSKYKEKCIQNWAIQKPENYPYENIKYYDQVENTDEILRYLRKHMEKVFAGKLRGDK